MWQHGVGPKKLTVTCRLKAALHSPHSDARANFVGEHSGLFLPYRVKQAAKRQAKQCTALFCPHPLTINNGLVDSGAESQVFANRITI
jgi:hypothetical protein